MHWRQIRQWKIDHESFVSAWDGKMRRQAITNIKMFTYTNETKGEDRGLMRKMFLYLPHKKSHQDCSKSILDPFFKAWSHFCLSNCQKWEKNTQTSVKWVNINFVYLHAWFVTQGGCGACVLYFYQTERTVNQCTDSDNHKATVTIILATWVNRMSCKNAFIANVPA